MNDDIEQVRVLNDDGTPSGEYLSKTKILEQGRLRPVVHIWIVNGAGQTVINTRTTTVKRWKGLKDVSVGEGVQGDESFLEAAVRGLEEELSHIVQPGQLREVGAFRMCHNLPGGVVTNEFDRTFVLGFEGDVSDFVLDDHELASVEWVELDELERRINSDEEYAKFIDHGKQYYLEVIAWLREN